MTTPYAGRHAELYDLFYREKPYVPQAKWISAMLPPKAAILDLACGTGGHALELAALGHHVTGIDLSPAMVEQARRKAQERGLSLSLSAGDMREFESEESSFGAVTCLFDSIGYLRTDEAIRATLSKVARVLQPQGLLVMEFWHKSAMLTRFDPLRVRRWATDEGRVIRISETELLREQDLARVAYSVLELRDDGTYSAFEEAHINRYFTVEAMEAFITEVGLAPTSWSDGFSADPVTEDTWHVVAVASRR